MLWNVLDQWRYGPRYNDALEHPFVVSSETLFWLLALTAVCVWMLWVTNKVLFAKR